MDLSVIIPVYNGEKTLSRALDSLFRHAPRELEWEAVLVNDGSADSSLSVCEEYRKRFPEKIRLLSRENRGVGATRTEGLAAAAGEYTTFLDCDDYYLPAFSGVGAILKEKKPDILFFDSCFAYDEKEPLPYPAGDFAGGFVPPQKGILSMPGPWNKIVKKSLYEKGSLTFPEGIWYEDLATCPALFRFADPKKIYYLKETLHAYYQSEHSIIRGEGYREGWKDIVPALSILADRLGEEYRQEAEYLAWFHLYRGYAWKFLEYGKTEEIKAFRVFMKHRFPDWKKNPYIRSAPVKEQITSRMLSMGLTHLLSIRQKKEIKSNDEM